LAHSYTDARLWWSDRDGSMSSMPRFQTIIRSGRFVCSPYTAYEMQGFALVLADSIRARIQSGPSIFR
jgi:hypothetical protein